MGTHTDYLFDQTKKDRMAELKFNTSINRVKLGIDCATWQDHDYNYNIDADNDGKDDTKTDYTGNITGYSLTAATPITDKLNVDFAYYNYNQEKKENGAWQIGSTYKLTPKFKIFGRYGVAENGYYYEHDKGIADHGFFMNEMYKLHRKSRKNINYCKIGTTFNVIGWDITAYAEN